jgi:hypothetical protein
LRACQRWEAYEYYFRWYRTVFNGRTTEDQRRLDELNLPFSSGPGLITETKTTNSFLWLAAIQVTERKQDSTSLAPKRSFVPAESIEREIGLISQAQKTLCERESGTISFHTKTEFGSSEQRLNNVSSRQTSPTNANLRRENYYTQGRRVDKRVCRANSRLT